MAEILVIDDEPQMRRLIARILTGARHTVREAENGEVGLRLFHERRPALVITDLIMPVGEGIETIQALRRDAPTVPILAISGSGPAIYLHAATRLGAAAALAKPFRPGELLAAVDGLLHETTAGGV